MNITEQVKKIAATYMQNNLPFIGERDAPFKSLSTVNISGEDKPLLLIGIMNGKEKRVIARSYLTQIVILWSMPTPRLHYMKIYLKKPWLTTAT